MIRKIFNVIISIIIGYIIGYLLRSDSTIVTGFIASMLTIIYFEMPNKK
ncbi:hypothetical protein EDD71_104186 [Fonticella tunisiensis]|uniref:Uncharacterized protein n=1 Tax=Fonticella tunisiensis TaxID=1096341 RepID=A0A4R7KS71_9CLOT|nr:hypothetical protein EDD71_104186 [Fonticella tunisiensis]